MADERITMSLSTNPAVVKAYEYGRYEDVHGTIWVKGMDGWFDRSDPTMICLIWHHNFVKLVERENPQEEDDDREV
jgi:hypothetical protein